jgi:hypothetical protein
MSGDSRHPLPFTAENLGPDLLREKVEPVLIALNEYEYWVEQHGYSSSATAEALLTGLFWANATLGSWLRIVKGWRSRCESDGDTIDVRIYQMVNILDEASKRIDQQCPGQLNDLLMIEGISPKRKAVRFDPVISAQLRFALDTAAGWVSQRQEEGSEERALLWHGGRAYSTPRGKRVTLLDSEHRLLQELMKRGTADTRQLEKADSNPAQTIGKLLDKYPEFGEFLRRPNGKGKGGYSLKMRKAPDFRDEADNGR